MTAVFFDDAEGFLFIDLKPEGWPSRDASSGVDHLLLASPASCYKRFVCDSHEDGDDCRSSMWSDDDDDYEPFAGYESEDYPPSYYGDSAVSGRAARVPGRSAQVWTSAA